MSLCWPIEQMFQSPYAHKSCWRVRLRSETGSQLISLPFDYVMSYLLGLVKYVPELDFSPNISRNRTVAVAADVSRPHMERISKTAGKIEWCNGSQRGNDHILCSTFNRSLHLHLAVCSKALQHKNNRIRNFLWAIEILMTFPHRSHSGSLAESFAALSAFCFLIPARPWMSIWTRYCLHRTSYVAVQAISSLIPRWDNLLFSSLGVIRSFWNRFNAHSLILIAFPDPIKLPNVSQ
jgi:hypothetical protein